MQATNKDNSREIYLQVGKSHIPNGLNFKVKPLSRTDAFFKLNGKQVPADFKTEIKPPSPEIMAYNNWLNQGKFRKL